MKCKACNGKGYYTGCIYESDEIGFVDKNYECAVCHGTGQIEQTNEKWFASLTTEEKAMAIDFHKNILESKEDVDEYINALRKQLLDYIEKNKSIMLK